MAIPTWPSAVPFKIDIRSYQEGTVYPRPLVTTFEDGNIRSRPRSLTTWTEVAFDLILTTAQFATLRDFFRTTLGNQSARFSMPIWRPGQNGTETKEAYAIDGLPGPTYQAAGKVRVSLKLRVKNW